MTNQEKGQSLFEVVVAIAISALIIVSLVSLVNRSIQNSTFSKNKALAATYAQQASEWLRNERDKDMIVFEGHVALLIWCLPDLTWTTSGACASTKTITGTPFVRQVNFSDASVGVKTIIQADIAVSWTDSQGLHKVTSATSFSDWRQR